MREITITGIANKHKAKDVYSILCDFKKFEQYSEAVREVTVSEHSANRSVTDWEVNFRQGILRWTEEDIYFPEDLHIHFKQLKGDAELFEGKWLLSDIESGCKIVFVAKFDMGIPSLSDIIEPIAELALSENIESILRGMLNDEVRFEKKTA